jgi:hypothetical protein
LDNDLSNHQIILPVQASWDTTAQVRLLVGSENVGTLAASTPSGGSLITQVPAWPGGGADRGGFGSGGFGAEPFGLDGFASQHPFGSGPFGVNPFGCNEIPPLAIPFQLFPADKCASVPIGIRVVDAAGNVSAVIEQLLWLADPPVGAHDLAVAPIIVSSSPVPGEVRLTWTLSPDV